MKKKLLILTLLFTTISSSFAGQIYLSASGYSSGVPYETGTQDGLYISSYYNYITISFGTTNVAGPDSFSFTGVLYDNFTNHQSSYNYGGNGAFPAIPTTPETIDVGTVVANTYVGVNLEVYGADAWATINF